MELTNLTTGSLTMSSREIADLCEKEHFHVRRDIETMCDGLEIDASIFGGIYLDALNRQQKEYQLPKRETMILVSGYRVDLRAKIVDRWMELEGVVQHRDPVEMLNDPAAMRGILLTYTEKVIALEAENKELGVKADALDRIATADGSLNVTEAAKALQVQPKALFQYLQTHGWIYKRPGSAHYLGYQSKVTTGLLEHKVATILRPDGTEKITEQVRITPKGLAALSKLFPPPVALVA